MRAFSFVVGTPKNFQETIMAKRYDTMAIVGNPSISFPRRQMHKETEKRADDRRPRTVQTIENSSVWL